MDSLVFSTAKLKLRHEQGKTMVLDILRRKYVMLTPEEWVRQHFIHFLIEVKKYPKALIRVEEGLKYVEMRKRSDLVVFRRDGGVFMVVECKSPKVKLNQKSMDQLSVYNHHYKADYLVLTNGLSIFTYGFIEEVKEYATINGIPEYQ